MQNDENMENEKMNAFLCRRMVKYRERYMHRALEPG
jgi:hypothetical protein